MVVVFNPGPIDVVAGFGIDEVFVSTAEPSMYKIKEVLGVYVTAR